MIRQAKTLGLALDEIGDILALRRGGTTPCRQVIGLLHGCRRSIDRTISDLRQLRRTLTDTRANAEEHLTDTGSVCGTIEHATPNHG